MISRMIVMHVRDHDMLDPVRGNANGAETVRDRADDRAAAAPCRVLIESGVDQDRALVVDDGPDVVVQRHRPVVLVAAQEIVPGGALEVGIADGEDFVGGDHAQ